MGPHTISGSAGMVKTVLGHVVSHASGFFILPFFFVLLLHLSRLVMALVFKIMKKFIKQIDL